MQLNKKGQLLLEFIGDTPFTLKIDETLTQSPCYISKDHEIAKNILHVYKKFPDSISDETNIYLCDSCLSQFELRKIDASLKKEKLERLAETGEKKDYILIKEVGTAKLFHNPNGTWPYVLQVFSNFLFSCGEIWMDEHELEWVREILKED